MTTQQFLADVLSSNLGMLKSTLADFSEADMLTRPVPEANHATWQLGHLIVAETMMVGAVSGGSTPALPDEFAKCFGKQQSRCDDVGAFPKKAELIERFEKVRSATIEWAKNLTPADLDQAAPAPYNSFCRTIAHLAFTQAGHATMHIGQFQVIRRALGKPILF